MKLVAIGDTHGRKNWEKIIEAEKDADKFVFIGDYFDTHHSVGAGVQIENFKNIMEFKKANPDKVVLLMGNHDFHYIKPMGEQYSGFQHKYADVIEELVVKAIADKDMQYCYQVGNILFTHAGITNSWCNANNLDPECTLMEQINALPLSAFRFSKLDGSGYGDHVSQGPIWVRPMSLAKDMIHGHHQVVGHTPQEDMLEAEIGNHTLTFIDCLGTTGKYYVREL